MKNPWLLEFSAEVSPDVLVVLMVGEKYFWENISGTTPFSRGFNLPFLLPFLLLCEAGVHKHGEHIWAFQKRKI